MVLMEFREGEYDRLLEKGKIAKKAICEVIEALYKCEPLVSEDEYEGEHDDEYEDDSEISYRGRGRYRRGMRRGYRHHGRYTY